MKHLKRFTCMAMAAAMALAAVIPEEELSEENIIPKPFDPRVVPAVAAPAAGPPLMRAAAGPKLAAAIRRPS